MNYKYFFFNKNILRFSVSEEIRNLWLTSIIKSYPQFKIWVYSHICIKHFLPTEYNVNARSKSKLLNKNSVLTVFDNDHVYVFDDGKLVNN